MHVVLFCLIPEDLSMELHLTTSVISFQFFYQQVPLHWYIARLTSHFNMNSVYSGISSGSR